MTNIFATKEQITKACFRYSGFQQKPVNDNGEERHEKT